MGQKMAVDPANADVVYVGTPQNGVWRTYDAGATWTPVTAIPNGADAGHTGIAFDPASGTTNGRTNTIYVPSNGNGIWRSSDAGASWTRIAGGGVGGPTSISHAVVANQKYYVAGEGTGGGAWKYSGGSWISLASEDYHTIAVDPFNGNHLVLGAVDGRLYDSIETA